MNRDDWKFLQLLIRYGLGLEDERGVCSKAPSPTGKELLTFVNSEGLAPYLHWALLETGLTPPPPFTEALKSMAAYHRDQLIRVHLAAAQALRLLKSWEIPGLVVKGLCLNNWWPVPMIRTMSDVDILIPWERRFDLWARSEPLLEIQRILRITPEVEPNHHDLSVQSTVPISFPDLFTRGQQGIIAGEEALIASGEDSLLFTATSSLRKDPRNLRLILDAAFLVRSGEVDLPKTLSRAKNLGIQAPLLLLLNQAKERFGVPMEIPPPSGWRLKGASSLIGLSSTDQTPPNRAFRGGLVTRLLLRLLLEPLHRLIRRKLSTLFPSPIALRNRNAKRGAQKAPIVGLYLRHFLGVFKKLFNRGG